MFRSPLDHAIGQCIESPCSRCFIDKFAWHHGVMAFSPRPTILLDIPACLLYPSPRRLKCTSVPVLHNHPILAFYGLLRAPLLLSTSFRLHHRPLITSRTSPTSLRIAAHTTHNLSGQNNRWRKMATLGAPRKHKVTVVGSGNW